MTLVVDELYDGVEFSQNFRINRSLSLAHFRPWMIKWGNPPAGELVMQILEGSTVLKEVRLAATDINTEITSTYFHGQIRFDLDAFQLNHTKEADYTEYTVKLFMDGYVTDVNNFYGTVRRYEQKFYDTYGDGVENGEAPNDMVEPLGFELFEFRY